MGLNIISNYTIGLCLLYIPIYTCTSIYTYINMVYDLLGRSDNIYACFALGCLTVIHIVTIFI